MRCCKAEVIPLICASLAKALMITQAEDELLKPSVDLSRYAKAGLSFRLKSSQEQEGRMTQSIRGRCQGCLLKVVWLASTAYICPICMISTTFARCRRGVVTGAGMIGDARVQRINNTCRGIGKTCKRLSMHSVHSRHITISKHALQAEHGQLA